MIQENSYYAFGMDMPGMAVVGTDKNKYLYNGKELQEDGGLGLYDYGARLYDPAIGKWTTMDPLSELMVSESTYGYGFNNPVRYTDPYGLAPNDGVGADGLTNEQWLESSRPGASAGLAATFKSENRQREIDGFRNEFNLASGELDFNAPGKQGEEVFRIYDGYTVHVYFSSWTGFKRGKSYPNRVNGDNRDWIRDALDYTGKGLSISGLAIDFRKAIEIEYLSQARLNRQISGNFSKTISHNIRGLRNVGNKIGAAGIVLTGVDIAYNGLNVSNGLDAVMGGLAFTGWGAPISATYFIANWATESITGQNIGQHIQGTFTDPKASINLWK